MTPAESLWAEAVKVRDESMAWLPSCKVELSRDPASNIGGLHVKASMIREEANKVRDVVYHALLINMRLRNLVSKSTWDFEQAKNKAAADPTVKARLASYKTKEERAEALQQEVAAEYKAVTEATARMEEWEQFMKAVNLVYYSLSDTRQDLNLQVSVVKQQMFNGEIKPNDGLEKLGSVFDMLGEGARNLLNRSESSGIPGKSGEVDWSSDTAT